jgi:hypothetical protein
VFTCSRAIITLRFYDVSGFEREGFNHQNALIGLALRREDRMEGRSPYFAIELAAAFGVDPSFQCLGIEVVDTVPCSDTGRVLLNESSEHDAMLS